MRLIADGDSSCMSRSRSKSLNGARTSPTLSVQITSACAQIKTNWSRTTQATRGRIYRHWQNALDWPQQSGARFACRSEATKKLAHDNRNSVHQQRLGSSRSRRAHTVQIVRGPARVHVHPPPPTYIRTNIFLNRYDPLITKSEGNIA
jgi:hypothetical protein